MIRKRLQRHGFLLLSAVLLFAICLLVGLGVMQHAGEGRLFGTVHAHAGYFLLWRLLVYAVVIFYWPQWIDVLSRKRQTHVDTRLTRTVSRQPIVLVCMAFELLIVQNVASRLLALVFQGTSG